MPCLKHDKNAIIWDVVIIILLILMFFVVREVLGFLFKTNSIYSLLQYNTAKLHRLEQSIRSLTD